MSHAAKFQEFLYLGVEVREVFFLPPAHHDQLRLRLDFGSYFFKDRLVQWRGDRIRKVDDGGGAVRAVSETSALAGDRAVGFRDTRRVENLAINLHASGREPQVQSFEDALDQLDI